MGQLRIRDIMTTQVVTLTENETIRDATITLAVDNLSGAPVVDDENHTVGILCEADILNLIIKLEDKLNVEDPKLHLLVFPMDFQIEDPKLKAVADEFSKTKVKDIMSRSLLTTTPDALVVDVLRVMIEKDVNRVPVLEKGVLVGIVSRGDIIFSIYKKKI